MSDQQGILHWFVVGRFRPFDDISIVFHPVDGPDLEEVQGLEWRYGGSFPKLSSRAHVSEEAFKRDLNKLCMYEAVRNITWEIVGRRFNGDTVYFDCKPTGDSEYHAEVIDNPYVEVPNDPSLNGTEGASMDARSDATSQPDGSVATRPQTTANQTEQPATTDD